MVFILNIKQLKDEFLYDINTENQKTFYWVTLSPLYLGMKTRKHITASNTSLFFGSHVLMFYFNKSSGGVTWYCIVNLVGGVPLFCIVNLEGGVPLCSRVNPVGGLPLFCIVLYSKSIVWFLLFCIINLVGGGPFFCRVNPLGGLPLFCIVL